MAVQISLAKGDTPYGVALPGAYVRITQVLIDWSQRVMQFQAAVWSDKDARDAGQQPIMQTPPIQIRDQAQPAQFRVLQDPQTGQNLLDEEGKPRFMQVAPALPSFEEVEQLIGAAVAAGQDYRTVGYGVLKKLDIIKNNSPVDLI